MDKNAIKKYAVWARRELIERVSQRVMIYGITAKDAGDPNVESVNGHLLSQAEKRQRQALIRNIKTKGYEQVVEEVAYTWFNRFAALRFMEVNGYLPSHIRVFTNDAGEFKPQILAEAIHLELEGLDMNKVYKLESANKSEELFKYLLIVQCNALNSILPGMFQRIEDYTELLLPDYLLREGSVIEQMVTTIPEEDWTDQVQIIGWLYQYYNTEPKDKVFADLKKNIKITKENIPAATQLFTPDWIVHYMVENSLGRLWLEGHPNNNLKSEWKYYLDEAEQDPEVQAQLDAIRKEYAALKPDEIRVIDPCMGSGHILCVLFDVLVHIYEDYGYTAREAAVKIVENNLWGLDIDERAAQLSYFAVMMKARQYDRRFFSRRIQPHVYAIEESNDLNSHSISYYVNRRKELKIITDILLTELKDAKEYGSILDVTQVDFKLLSERIEEVKLETTPDINTYFVLDELQPFIKVAQAMAQKYHVVVTNPPYMGSSGMGGKLSTYLKNYYPNSKNDLFAVFIERCEQMLIKNGYLAMITQHAWMFLGSFERLREKILRQNIITMAHLGIGTFEDLNSKVVQSVAFTIRKNHTPNYKGIYDRLFEKQGLQESNDEKQKWIVDGSHRFISYQDRYHFIPGSPVAYWVSDSFISAFKFGKPLGECIPVKKGMDTGDNDKYLRLWFEVNYEKIDFFTAKKKWVPYDKGGDFRKWYGNNSYIVNWENDGFELKHSKANLRSPNLYFRESITWNALSSGNTCFRYSMFKGTFDSAGSSMFPDIDEIPFYLGLMNSKISQHYLNVINPTINYGAGSVSQVPVLILSDSQKARVSELSKLCISLYKTDWDNLEVSWDFKRHPLVRNVNKIEEAFAQWKDECTNRYNQIKLYEEELNSIFINVYGLSDELISEVANKDVTIYRANLQKDIRSLISYAVGCMFGRYSLDNLGLIYAGGDWDSLKYNSFKPDKDAIIPICNEEYFEDDIVDRFVRFVEVVYGKKLLEENLQFIASALDGKGSSRDVIRDYFINNFYADHLKTYQKRPIYWLFNSGKKNGFKCLIYMHRYQQDTIARIRTEYVHEQQSRYRTAIADLEQRMSGAPTSERVKLMKQLVGLQAQAEEIQIYEEKIHHLADQMIKIDLDDGVKTNYDKFKDVLGIIK